MDAELRERAELAAEILNREGWPRLAGAVGDLLAALDAAERERDVTRQLLDELAVAIEPLRHDASRAVELQVAEVYEATNAARAADPSGGEPWCFGTELRRSLRRERGLAELDRVCVKVDRFFNATPPASEGEEVGREG